ncbi:hypothetical protein TH66_00825 [Carbonactinospora thermoautotrophica]|uniref:Type II toxin-antitoxin system RelE/ParE family toxin n=1 Tax=Carbonactinospora thermoautotrophica TaxID=1469144 RepID=A0A132MZV7_9ACTN|nr:hypothetical protein [Carbonactinospora thermoautotrophica]KWX03191.1 hypothetical protein LI90_4242 [Carbonactinospora thermoautotrophica]KWX03266.1 hypothetical protein LI90_4317 [Carbonactinospora thermoautotrophica]KWX05899.1 hypothetical protein TH66_00825 [Carbonactinospora thermoautotrophica]KWX09212.1 hypothetical protein TR74_10935 [Carbonactinospora thermoautotrophica]
MYRVEYTAQAKAARDELPFLAKRALDALVLRMRMDPTSVGRSTGGDMRNRIAEFGNYGLVFYFDDMQGLITIRDIVWGK